MSVRRLADDAVQPDGFKFNPAMLKQAKGWIKKYPKGREQSAVIPLLMLAQEQDGWVTRASIEHISNMLDMPLIRVLEVATFYTQFQLQPVGTKAHVQICGTTPCMLRGSEELIALCKDRIHQEPFHLNDEGTLSWEEVECQGACVNAPMVMIFKDTYEDLTPQRLSEIIDAFEAGKGDTVTPGPQIDRIYSAPEGGPTSLTGGDNPTMKLAKTAKAKRKAPAKKRAASDPVANRLATVDDTTLSKTNKAKAGSGRTGAKDLAKPEPTMSAVKAAKAVTKKPTGKSKTVAKSNPTMNIAATASGRAKPSAKKTAGPVRLKKPQGKADDLKMISGVGPKLEKTLNDLGFWHFHQIAAWKKADVAVVDNELSFKGRIERDEWIKQAKVLAKAAAKNK